MCLNDWGGSFSAGDPIRLYSCPDPATSNELWTWNSDYTIRAASHQNVCFNSWGGQLTYGEQTHLNTCSAAPNELWTFNADGTIASRTAPSMCLNDWGGNFASGDQIALYPCQAAANMVFIPQVCEWNWHAAVTVGACASTAVRIHVSSTPSLCFNDWGGGLHSADPIKLYTCQNPPVNNEKVIVGADYTIRMATNTALCFNSYGGTLNAGEEIHLYTCSAHPNEIWNIRPDGTIQSQTKPSMCMSAVNSQIVLAACSTAANMVFRFLTS